MSDIQLRQDVLDELEFDPRFDAAHIGVAVEKNVVTLAGHVHSYAEKGAALAAAQRVKGVRAIADELEIRYPFQSKTSDNQIAQRALDIMKWNALLVPADAINVLVKNGWVTLSGTVNWQYERKAAEDDVRKLTGVIGVTNSITIKPRFSSKDICRQIEAALRRRLRAEANAIRVTVDGANKVVLEGTVDNWEVRRAVKSAAWSAPGVTSVDDHLVIN